MDPYMYTSKKTIKSDATSGQNPNKQKNTPNRTPYLSSKSNINTKKTHDYLELPENQGCLGEAKELPISSSSILPSYLLDGTCGIDMVSIAVPMSGEYIDDDESSDEDLDLMDRYSGDFIIGLFGPGKYKSKVVLPGLTEVRISWNFYSLELNVRFNPSNITRQEGFEICPIGMLPDVIDKVLRALFNYAAPGTLPPYDTPRPLAPRVNMQTGEKQAQPKNWKQIIHLSAIDVTRDLMALDSRFSLEQMKDIHPKGYTNITHHRNHGKLNTITHVSGPKSPRFKFYDKHEERARKIRRGARHLDVVPEGTLRFEVHIPRKYLTEKLAIYTLHDLSSEKFLQVAQNLWETSNLSRPLIWEGQKTQEMLDAGIPNFQVHEFIGLVHAVQSHVHLQVYSGFDEEFFDKLETVGFKFEESPFTQGRAYAKWNFETGNLQIL